MPLITAAQLERVSPVAVPHIVAAIAGQADRVFPKYGLTTLLRVQHFLAQIAEETGGFRILFENLNYTAEGLLKTWPSRFHSYAQAVDYAHQPEKIANYVYGGRMGNVVWGDGWKYRGQGLLQETGHDMFALLEKATGLPLVAHPELAAGDDGMLECAVASFVRIPGVLDACDRDDVVHVTKLVNGGLINLATRELYLAHVKQVVTELGANASTPVATPGPMPMQPPPPAYTTQWVQAALNDHGAFPRLWVDGVAGPKTAAAMRQFQAKRGLMVTGTEDASTLRELANAA